MTPNPNSPAFIMNEVPEFACDSAKQVTEVYSKIKEDAKNGKWKGISEDNVSLEYNNYDESTRIEAILNDSNNHIHCFTIQLLPDNGFGDGTDYLYLKYQFDGVFDENELPVRSFTEYLFVYLEWEGFNPLLIHCGKGIDWLTTTDRVYYEFCKLIDSTISKLKPLDWFFTKEPYLKSYEDMHYYFLKILSMLKSRADYGKWYGLKANCIEIISDKTTGETSIYTVYIVDDVWKWQIHVDGVWCDKYADLSCGIACFPHYKLSTKMQKKLDNLFKEFLESLSISKGNMYVGGERGEHILSIQYFHIEDSLEVFCSLIDEVTTQLKSFNFHLSSPSTILTDEMETIKKQLEESLNTSLSVITEEDEINRKLNTGYFKVLNMF